MDASEQDPESQAGHGGCRQRSDALMEPLLSDSQPVTISILPPRSLAQSLAESASKDKDAWESLIRDQSAHFREYVGERDRMLSSLAAYEEQAAAHRETGRTLTRIVDVLTILYWTFLSAIAHLCGLIDLRPRFPVMYTLGAIVGLITTALLLRIAEQLQHMKEAPGEFRFKFNFENMPALQVLAGEQKWKEIQACSDNIRVMEDLQAIVLKHQSQAVTPPSSFSEWIVYKCNHADLDGLISK